MTKFIIWLVTGAVFATGLIFLLGVAATMCTEYDMSTGHGTFLSSATAVLAWHWATMCFDAYVRFTES